MTKIVKEHKSIALVVMIGLCLTAAGIIGMYGLAPSSIDTVEAATSADVVVTATVQEWISITASVTSTTLSPDLVSTAGVAAIASSTSITITAKSNSDDGYQVTIEGDNNGLSATTTIASVDASTTTLISAGTDGYGANATSTESTIGTYYDNWGSHTLGAIRTGAQVLASSTSTSDADGHVTSLKIEAACDTQQEQGSYTDTVTLTILATAP